MILPNSGTATSGPSPVAVLLLDRPSNISSYLLFRSDPGVNHVLLGMDVPPHVRANWTIGIIYNEHDTIHFAASNRVHIEAQRLSSSEIQVPGYVAAAITGSMTSTNSFTQFQNGYWAEYTKEFGATTRTGLPTDVDTIQFTLDGPVPITTAVGSTISVALPSLDVINEPPVSGEVKGAAPAPFNSEDLYSAGSYQNLTGGPKVEGVYGWDWFNAGGVTPPITATGVDNATQQSDQNKTFAAAVLFGVAASAGAVFCVELVGAIQEERRARRSRSSGHLSVG